MLFEDVKSKVKVIKERVVFNDETGRARESVFDMPTFIIKNLDENVGEGITCVLTEQQNHDCNVLIRGTESKSFEIGSFNRITFNGDVIMMNDGLAFVSVMIPNKGRMVECIKDVNPARSSLSCDEHPEINFRQYWRSIRKRK